MNADEKIQVIKTALAAALPSLVVEEYPTNPMEYRLTHPKGAVLILYDGTTASAPIGVQQAVLQTIKIEVHLRNFASHQAMYDVLETIRKTMAATVDTTGTRFYLVSERRLGFEAGVWYWGQVYTIGGIYIYGD